MKKKSVMILTAALATAMLAGGCGKQGSDASSASAEADTVISARELLKTTAYDVEDYVTLNDYMNMTVELSTSYEITDQSVNDYIDYMIAQYPVYEPTDKTTVEEGDIVNIDYLGTKDGEAFDGGTAEGAHLEIGSDSFIDGFEDGLIGTTVGETVDLNLTFPEDYQNSEELAGQDVVFTVTVNSIDSKKTITCDEMTDEYVSDNFASSGVSTVEELKEQVTGYLESQNENYKMQEIEERVLEKLTEECAVEFPEGLLDQKIADYKERLQEDADAADQTLAEFLESSMGMTEEQFEEELQSYMEESLTQELILEAIVQDLDLSISLDDYSAFVSNYISAYGIADEATFYEQYGGEDFVKLSYAENQALLQVINSVKTTVSESAADDAQNVPDESADGTDTTDNADTTDDADAPDGDAQQ